ncbi:hypothetical protein GCM10023188_25860 [Pontibacter saemangeumensis]|uniref:Uncharacterized protein n=1 Tax=Pontibacter saemangeumensis TaxID=1084525 RepID=A0ABP8LSN9_9BACT
MAAPTTVEEQELDKLTNPAEAGSIEQTIKVFPDASKLDPNKTQGRHHRTLLTSLLTRTKAWVKVLYDKQNYAGPYRAGTVTAGDMHWTKTTTELTIWKALADFTAEAAPVAGAQWEQFAVLPVTVTPQDFTDIEARLLELETAMASDDPSLDTIQEIVTYIKDNRASLQTLGGVLDGIIEVTDEIDLRLIEAEAAIIALQQVVASNDPNLDTIQKIVNYIKSTTPGTTGSVGSTPTWIVSPRVTVDASLNIVVLNQSPNEPTADWNDQNLVFGTGIIFPAVVPPAEGIYRTDAIDAAPNGIYEHVKGEESPTAAASPALLNNRLRAAYIIWAGSTGTVTYPEGNGYWGGMQYSSTDSRTIEEYFLSLLGSQVNDAWLDVTDAASVTLSYMLAGKERPNQRITPATLVTITGPSDLPVGGDMRLKFLNPGGKEITLSGTGHKDLFGNPLTALPLNSEPEHIVLINNAGTHLTWSLTGMVDGLPDMTENRILARFPGAGTGAPQEAQLGAGMYMDSSGFINQGFLNIGDTVYGGMPYPANSSIRLTSNHVGYISIKVPFSEPGFIAYIEGVIRELDGADTPSTDPYYNKITGFQIGGSCAAAGNAAGKPEGWWGSTSALMLTKHPARDLTVRYVTNEADGTYYIYLGEPTTQWSGMMMSLKAVLFANQIGGSSVVIEEARENWLVEQRTTITGTVYATEAGNLPLAQNGGTGGETGSGSFTPITAAQYNTYHPAFSTQAELNAWLLGNMNTYR